jgi:SSS family solute:Na+ symporter
MSSLSSVFNSCSTLISWDFYKKFKPEATEAQLILVGRLATGVLVFLGLLWIPFMKHISAQLYIYLQSVQAYIAPPIAACFLLGIFFPQLNGKGAITSLLSGAVFGVLRLVLELANGSDKMGLADGTIWSWIAEINFLHFAVLLFVVSSVILTGVSLLTERPSREQIAGLTYATGLEGAGGDTTGERAAGEPDEATTKNQIILSVLVVAILVVLWIIFA